jgi:hypothetical protein
MPGPSVLVRLIADNKDFKKGVDGATGATDGFKSNLLKVGTAIGAAFAAKKVIDFAKDSIAAAQDLNANMSRTKTIFGEASDSVAKWSEGSAKSLRISQADALGYANTIGKTLVGSFGLSETAAAKMSIEVVQTAKDMATFNRIPMDQALSGIQKGLSGATRGLKDMGVVISQSEIELKAVQLGLGKTTVDMSKVESASLAVKKAQLTYNDAVKKSGKESSAAQKALLTLEGAQSKLDGAMKSGKTTVDAAGKAQATFALIQEKGAFQMGATERGAGSLKAQQEKLSAEWKNAQATLGNALLPVVTKVAVMFTDNMVPVIGVVAKLFDQFGVVLIPLVAGLAAVVAITKVWTIVQTALNVVLHANPIGLIVVAVALLVAGIVYLATQTRFFQAIWEGAMKGATIAINWVKDAAVFVFNWIKNNWPYLLAILGGPFGLAIALIISHFDKIKGVVLGVINWVRDNWKEILLFLTGPIGAAIAIITKVFNVDLLGVLTGLPAKFYDAGKAMLEALGRGIADAGLGVVDKAKDVVGKVRGLLPFSPAKWGPLKSNPPEQGGAKIMQLLTEGLQSQARQLERVATKVMAPLAYDPNANNVPNLAFDSRAGGNSNAATSGPTGPAVTIGEVHVHDEVEVEDFTRKLGWLVQTARI